MRDRTGRPPCEAAYPVEGCFGFVLGKVEPGTLGVGVLIQITPQLRILVAIDAIDGRKGIDSLAQLCREKLDADPFSGCLFIFRSRSGKAIRILAYDGQGFGLRRSDCRKAVSGGGPAVRKLPAPSARIRRSYCWPPRIRMPRRRRYGGR